ncbi:M15 family metallopeptidase [Treponema pectinovorum]|uniref:M15 family metallopeptidase n=1 Tax=Treponema pectinovorum TaxID=164 RepID=UPI0011F182C8|nr:M15 family metallopeptidase [Treponema pectinovorum]
MKKIIFIASFVFCLFGCAKSSATNGIKNQSGTIHSFLEKKSEKTSVDLKENLKSDAQIEKLRLVLSKMSERCKNAIPNGDANEFLADLDEVLKSEAEFNSDDLSPFFLIDKQHRAPENYEPKNLIHLEKNPVYNINKNNLYLRQEAFNALKELAQAAKEDGVILTVSSTYRSYEYQVNLFNYWVKVDGLEEAERSSSRAGTSQHQLGLVIDFAPVSDAFDQTPAGQWIFKNASKYGWSLSFPKGYEDVTGYKWESWHFRYVGKKACEFQQKWFSNVQQFMIEFLSEWKNCDLA